jgi:enoyl-CoA hydratase/carnithine racemase
MATDIRIAAHPKVTFTMSETKLGVVPAVISKCALPVLLLNTLLIALQKTWFENGGLQELVKP